MPDSTATHQVPATQGADARPQGPVVSGRWIGAIAGLCALAALLWVMLLSPRTSLVYGIQKQRRITLQKLSSPDPQQRKRAAWRTLLVPDPAAEKILREGLQGAEPDPDVREAYVYALGRGGAPRHVPLFEHVIEADPSGYVRAAAWLALARTDPQAFERAAERSRTHAAGWDRLGVGLGRLHLRDMSAIDELLDWAVQGDHAQRTVAARALGKSLALLLQAAGRWPLDVEIPEEQPWAADLVARVRRRAEYVDLQAVADDMLRHAQAVEEFRSRLRRVLSARDQIAEWLFD